MPRLPEIFKREELPEDKRWVHDYLIEKRGKISNGYAPYLNAPEYVVKVAQLGTYIRFESSLPQRAYELLAFVTSAERDNPYEGDLHQGNSAKLGVAPALIEAVCAKAELKDQTSEDALYVRCAREMMRENRLSDESFEEVRRRHGDRGVIDLIGTIGFYAMLACVHNGMQVRGPA